MHLLIAATFLLLTQHCLTLDLIPVFLVDTEDVLTADKDIDEPNPFHELEPQDFYKFIREAMIKFEMVIVFVENNFSIEDISVKDSKGTPFYNLRQKMLQKKVKYMPAVRQPYKTISSILPPLYKNTFYLSSPSAQLNLPDGLKYFYVHFQDGVDETRAVALRRHDQIIESVFYSTRQFSTGPIMAVYTGKRNPILVEHFDESKYKKREYKEPSFLVESEACLLSFQGFGMTAPTRRHGFSSSNLPKVTGEECTSKKQSTRVSYMDYELQFDFTFRTHDWILDSVALLEEGEEVGRTVMGVGAPIHCSYSCADPLVIINNRDGSAVSLSHYKIQPFPKKNIRTRRENNVDTDLTDKIEKFGDSGSDENKGDAGGDITGDTGGDTTGDTGGDTTGDAGGSPIGGSGGNSSGPVDDTNNTLPAPDTDSTGNDGPKTFGTSVDCGPYFNAPILSALAVVFVCLATYLYFITLMMACHTNDKYDNVNQKPLVIAAQG